MTLVPPRSDQLQSTVELLPYLARSHDAVRNHARLLYRPDRRLATLIDEYQAYLTDPLPRDATAKEDFHRNGGRLLEKIALVAFSGIAGLVPSDFESIVTGGPQYDLLIGGRSALWVYLSRFLGMPPGAQHIVVECKARRTRKKIDHPEMSRMCSILDHHLNRCGGMGVFFSSWGLSGDDAKALQAGRVLQALFFARTGKPIVVFDNNDLQQLTKRGALLVLLSEKVRALEVMARERRVDEPCREPLPPHLAGLI